MSRAWASQSMIHEPERSRANVSTISGKRWVRPLRGRLESRTRGPSFRSIIRKPSCLISCSHWLPEGSLSVLVGRHGAMNPAGYAATYGLNKVGQWFESDSNIVLGAKAREHFL